jgi:hypothetical protein
VCQDASGGENFVKAQRTESEYVALLRHVSVSLETGVILWATKHTGRPVGKPAGCVKANGYIYINHMGLSFLAHRVVFFAATGRIPSGLDHIDRNAKNNAIENLREASQTLNNLNRGMMPFNRSGETGIELLVAIQKWRARIKVNGRVQVIGDYATKGEATVARADEKARIMEMIQ